MTTREQAAAALHGAPVVAAPGADGWGGGEDEGGAPLTGDAVYDGCPVTPLGYDGDLCFYLDVADQLREVETHTQDKIISLFGGREAELRLRWPRYGKASDGDGKAKIVGWNHAEARAGLMKACFERGQWNAASRVRGVGAWPGEGADDPPILHCGHVVIVAGEERSPGMIGGRVYPAEVRQPTPWHRPVAASGGPGERATAALRTWRLANGDGDARLILGWICAAMFGGALDWRPMIWLTGDAGTGKSHLDKFIAAILGGETAVVQSSDASEPSVRQRLKLSALPVLLDEIESEADGAKARAVIKLARQAASGGVVMRGGADNKSMTEFKAQSCFKFSSILIPTLGDQDVSRLAVIDLQPLAKGAVAPRLDQRSWALEGRKLRRRILDEWPRWHETLETYRAALARAGHSARGCDQFGTLLAMADLALMEGAPDPDSVDEAIAPVTAERVAQRMDSASDSQRCLRYLAGQATDRHVGGGRVTLAELIAAAADLTDGQPLGPKEANRELGRYGLRVYGRRKGATVAVANVHDGLRKLFDGSRWATERGQTGVWAQSIRRAPGAEPSSSSISFARAMSRAWVLPIAQMIDDGDETEQQAGSAGERDVVWGG